MTTTITPDSANALNPDLDHDTLGFLLSLAYPDAEPGKDFSTGHIVDDETGERVGSAVILNLILWTGLIVSIPIRGVNPLYGTAALAGVLVMGLAATLVYGVMEGQGRSERIIRWIARKVRVDDDKAARVLHRVAERLEQLISDRQLLGRVAFWAALNWLFDAAALWVFLRAFGVTMSADALIISFGIANVLAAIPITPGGLGYVDASYIGMLVGFGADPRSATLGEQIIAMSVGTFSTRR